MSSSIDSLVKSVVARHFGIAPSKVRTDASFIGDLGGDALDLIELGYQFETAFDVSLSPSERDSLTTAGAVVDCLRSRGVAV